MEIAEAERRELGCDGQNLLDSTRIIPAAPYATQIRKFRLHGELKSVKIS